MTDEEIRLSINDKKEKINLIWKEIENKFELMVRDIH
jgi:hypothetical protein